MTETTETLKQVADLYTKSLKEHGTASKGVGWTTEEGHNIRFDQLNKLITPGDEPITVNDLGCGYGAMYEYLLSEGHRIEKFYGYDIAQDMLDTARQRIPDAALELFNAPKLATTADYTFASGIFNVRFKENDEAWLAFILETLEDMNAHSTKGFAFNLLTSYVDWKEEHLFYGDPCFFFDYCKKHFSKKVAMLHETPLWEWTLLVKKD